MKLVELLRSECVDARQNVCVPINRIDTISFARCDEGEVNGNSFGALVGAGKQTIFSDENPAFDCPLGFVIVDGDIWIFEKSGQSEPVIQRVVNCFHQFVSRIECFFSFKNNRAEGLYEGFRFFASHRQPVFRLLVSDVALNFVQLSVDVENSIADIFFRKLSFEVFASRVSVASSLDSFRVGKQSVKTSCGISLNDARKTFEEFEILTEREIRRIVKDSYSVFCITDVGCDFAFSNLVLVFAILNFYGRVVGFDDVRIQKFFDLQLVQKEKCVGGCLHPLALGRARNYDVLAREDLLLAMIWKSVIEFTDNDFAQQSRAGVAAGNGRHWLFCSDNIQFAFGTSPSLLAVLEDLQACANHLKLMSEQVADEICFDIAMRAKQIFWTDLVWNGFVRDVLSIFDDMLNSGRLLVSTSRGASDIVFFRLCGTRIVLFRFLSVLSLVFLFCLGNQMSSCCSSLPERACFSWSCNSSTSAVRRWISAQASGNSSFSREKSSFM